VEDAGRALKLFRWGLIASWAKEAAIGYKLINARAETVREKPSFKKIFHTRRCLVVADGFYEWKLLDAKTKQPTRIVLRTRKPFAMAGLWDSWQGPDAKPLSSFTIITTSANDTMRPIHDRMPVILTPQGEGAWLDPKTPADALTALLKPYEGALETYTVSKLVNSPRNEVATCIEPENRANG
jgi:putative SOS response-associated peptidase YedK